MGQLRHLGIIDSLRCSTLDGETSFLDHLQVEFYHLFEEGWSLVPGLPSHLLDMMVGGWRQGPPKPGAQSEVQVFPPFPFCSHHHPQTLLQQK